MADSTRILWKLLPGCGKLDHLREGAPTVLGGVRCLPDHFGTGGGWVLARYLGEGSWEAASHVEIPPRAGMGVSYDDARWHWVDPPAPEAEEPTVPLDELVAWLRGLKVRPFEPFIDSLIELALEKWGGKADEEAGS